jgi:cobalt-zinc-cadmium efflux system membrane fusion protein
MFKFTNAVYKRVFSPIALFKKYNTHHAVANLALAFVLVNSSIPMAQAQKHGHDDHEQGHDEQGHNEASPKKTQASQHGGIVFTSGHINVELMQVEGDGEKYKAWITDEGQSITKGADLSINLSRLNGEVNTLKFSASNSVSNKVWLADAVVQEPHSFKVTITLIWEGQTHTWNFDSFEGRAHIKHAIAAKAGIKTKRAGPGEIKQTITVYGKAVADTSKISHIKARFAGIISQVKVSIGDNVKKGQVLAVIESNESLNRYNITAPFSGTITNRHAAVGEQTEVQSLFTLANFDQVWAEFQIFPTQSQKISAGQAVTVSLGNRHTQATLKHLIPSTNGQPFMVARALVSNKNGQWTPGLLVEGRVTVQKINTPLRINNLAIQLLNDEPVAFIKVGEQYQARPLTLGLSDNTHTQVLAGLKPGDEYVVQNSYLIKADLEKSGASHDH